MSIIKAYIEEFKDLSNHTHRFSTEFEVEKFIVSFKEMLHHGVVPFKPRIVIKAKNMALMQESKVMTNERHDIVHDVHVILLYIEIHHWECTILTFEEQQHRCEAGFMLHV